MIATKEDLLLKLALVEQQIELESTQPKKKTQPQVNITRTTYYQEDQSSLCDYIVPGLIGGAIGSWLF